MGEGGPGSGFSGRWRLRMRTCTVPRSASTACLDSFSPLPSPMLVSRQTVAYNPAPQCAPRCIPLCSYVPATLLFSCLPTALQPTLPQCCTVPSPASQVTNRLRHLHRPPPPALTPLPKPQTLSPGLQRPVASKSKLGYGTQFDSNANACACMHAAPHTSPRPTYRQCGPHTRA